MRRRVRARARTACGAPGCWCASRVTSTTSASASLSCWTAPTRTSSRPWAAAAPPRCAPNGRRLTPDAYRERCDARRPSRRCAGVTRPIRPSCGTSPGSPPSCTSPVGSSGSSSSWPRTRWRSSGLAAASPYALENARSLARGVAGAMTVISGMASGVDTAAHEGALHARGDDDRGAGELAGAPLSAVGRLLHQRILATGAAVSELGPGRAACAAGCSRRATGSSRRWPT